MLRDQPKTILTDRERLSGDDAAGLTDRERLSGDDAAGNGEVWSFSCPTVY